MARRVNQPPIIVTEADLLDALATASTAPEDAKTAHEMARETGLALWAVQKALRALHAEGRLRAHRKPHVGIDGRRGLVPAYTILPKRR